MPLEDLRLLKPHTTLYHRTTSGSSVTAAVGRQYSSSPSLRLGGKQYVRRVTRFSAAVLGRHPCAMLADCYAQLCTVSACTVPADRPLAAIATAAWLCMRNVHHCESKYL